MGEIADLLKQIAGKHPVLVFDATVVSIDKDANTIVAQPVDGSPEIPDVKLTAAEGDTGLVCYPAKDSNVTIIIKQNDIMNAFVAMATNIEEYVITIGTVFKCRLNSDGLVLNDGKNGAMVNVGEVVKMANYVTALAHVLTAWVPVPGDGGTVLKTALTSALSGLPLPDVSQINDDKITH